MQEPVDRGSGVALRRIRMTTLVGVGIGMGFVWLAFRRLEPSGIVEALGSAQPWPWIPLAALSYLSGHVVRGLRCRRLVSNDADLPLATATNIVVLGYAVNNVLPARMGEVARAGLLSDRIGMPFVQSLTVTLLERILDGWTILLFFFTGIALVSQVESTMIDTARATALLFSAFSVGILSMRLFPYRIASFASHLAGRAKPSWQDPVWRLCIHVSNGLAYLRHPTDVLRLGGLSVAVWILETGMFLLVLPAFGLPLRFDWAVLAMAATNLAILVPSTPGYIGPFHFFCMQSLILLGVTALTATSYAIAVHAVFYVPITLWGVGVVIRYGIEWGWMAARASEATHLVSTTTIDGVPLAILGTRRVEIANDSPGRLIVALTEALLPSQQQNGSGAPPADVTGRVAFFVQGQIAALPLLLRGLLFVGLLGFRILVRMRYFRGFCRLPLPTRRRIVNAWAYGRYTAARQLFRVLRSTALLSYYEDVSVTDSVLRVEPPRARR